MDWNMMASKNSTRLHDQSSRVKSVQWVWIAIVAPLYLTIALTSVVAALLVILVWRFPGMLPGVGIAALSILSIVAFVAMIAWAVLARD